MWKVPKYHNFGRLGISCFEKEGFWKTHCKSWESSSTLLLLPELIWGSPYGKGLQYHIPFRGHIKLTNYNLHAHVQYCITIHYHSCSIDKYRNVEGPRCHNFGRLGIIPFWEGRTSELRSTGHKLVPLLAMRCHYQGVYIWPKVSLTQRLTKCQADLT